MRGSNRHREPVRYVLLSALLAVVAVALARCNWTTGGDGSAYKLHGLNFSPYREGQDPNLRVPVSEQQLMERMRIIVPYTNWIRTFGSLDGLENAGRIAHDLGLEAAIGAWLDEDTTTNNQELANLISAARSGHVEIAIVGNEVLLRGSLSESQLLDYIAQVRAAIPQTIPVTTVDVCEILLDHPSVISAVDVVFVNQYSYWEGVGLDCAVAALHSCYQRLVAASGGKQVVVSETGWPSCGDQIGEAVPSLENASRYFSNSISWARANNVSLFYFEAFDESWKAQFEGPQGACWGVWDAEGNLKPGMQAVFDGRTTPDNWSDVEIPGGTGNPEIELTLVPELGSFDDLEGQVWHVSPTEYRVAVYIYVSGWWSKPYWYRPLTTISCDGSWTCDITTGGIDEQATRIAAYVVPIGYSPPLMSGEATLPPELEDNAVAKVEVTRPPLNVR
jgi:exo-beta-1,3-glucanase (GH17 family)